ncbi:MAG: dipeptide ABC transporter ATP-binding protein [Treponema sp.]|jgi:microcin C transport system ATP-binding protein|nr:dipeptide ABC transporter ATP-binding protein [Treponema sp.]
MPHLVEYRDFTATFGNTHEVVHGINFFIDEHETFALVGESGSGKTVTAQALMRLISEEWLHYPRGKIFFEGNDLLAMNEQALRALRGSAIGMIFQEPMTSLNPLHTIEKQLSESLFLHQGLSKEKARHRTVEWLYKVGLREPEKRLSAYPHQLSGGERQRVMIALALLNKPKLLIADEPTTALDVTIQDQILTLLSHLQQELGMAILFISHDLGIVRRMAHRIAVMKDGIIVESGTSDQLFTAPRMPYTKELLGYGGSDNSPEPDYTQANIVSAENINVHFPIKKGFFRKTVGFIKAVDGVTLNLRRGQTVGVVGESGSGKTTLGRALLRLEQSTGSITINGSNIQNLHQEALRSMRKKMQIIFQDPYGSLNPRMNIEHIVGEGLLIHNIGTPEERQTRIRRALDEVGLSDPSFLYRYPNEFSGGQRQRIALARSLVLEPELLVLDEPTSSLDRTIQFQVINLLKELQERHTIAYLFISHDLRIVRTLCHEILIMQNGIVVESGPTGKIMSQPQHPYTKELLRTAFAS